MNATTKKLLQEAYAFLAEGRHRWTRGAMFRTKSGHATDANAERNDHVARCCSLGALKLAQVRLGADPQAYEAAEQCLRNEIVRQRPSLGGGVISGNDIPKSEGGLGYDGVLEVFQAAGERC